MEAMRSQESISSEEREFLDRILRSSYEQSTKLLRFINITFGSVAAFGLIVAVAARSVSTAGVALLLIGIGYSVIAAPLWHQARQSRAISSLVVAQTNGKLKAGSWGRGGIVLYIGNCKLNYVGSDGLALAGILWQRLKPHSEQIIKLDYVTINGKVRFPLRFITDGEVIDVTREGQKSFPLA